MKTLTLSYVTLPWTQIPTQGGHQYSEETSIFPPPSLPSPFTLIYLHE